MDSTRTLDGMRIGTDKAAQIVRCLSEGLGVRATARLAGVDQHTVLDLIVLVGQRCKLFMEKAIVNVPVEDVQADELYSFVFCKDKTRRKLSLPIAMYGDQYCFVGIERHHKLVLAWFVGERNWAEGEAFLRNLSRACWKQPFHISTDGWMPYKRLVPRFLPYADFGMLIKIYGNTPDTVRYSPGQIIEVKRKAVWGNPDPDRLCTSHVERHNLSIRMGLRRFRRLTNGFSRKFANHEAALGLYFAAYNFVQRHGTLKTTPAVAAGLTDHRWTADELIERTMDYNPPKPPTALERAIERIPDDE